MPHLKSLNLSVELQKGSLYGKEQFNIIAHKGPYQGPALLFNTHVDTVSAGDFSLWDKTGGNPFRATVCGDKIYGLGTADVKLDAICKIKALEKFSQTEFKNPFYLILTYGEESGLVGAKQILEEKKISPKYAVVGEPSNLNIVYAHKGHSVLEITLTDSKAEKLPAKSPYLRLDFLGQSAHASTPDLGINALEQAFEFIKNRKSAFKMVSLEGGELVNVIPDKACLKIRTTEKILPIDKKYSVAQEESTQVLYQWSAPFHAAFDEWYALLKKTAQNFKKEGLAEFDPPYTLLNLALAKTQGNEFKLTVALRTLPTFQSDEFMSLLNQSLLEIQNKYPDIPMTCTRIRESQPMKTDVSSKLIRQARAILQDMGLQDILITKSGSTEASIYAHMGAEVFVWGPGIAHGNIHRPNEFNYIYQLNHAVTFYEKLIQTFCVKGV